MKPLPHHICISKCWTVPQHGGVQVFLPLDQPGETQVLYHCLVEHLSSSAFSGIPERVAEWRQMVAQYLTACYRLLNAVTGEVEAVLGVKVAGDRIEEPGIMTAFPLTICFDAGGEAAAAKEVDKGENRSDPYLYGSSALALGAGAPYVALQEVSQLGVGVARFGGGGNRAADLGRHCDPFLPKQWVF